MATEPVSPPPSAGTAAGPEKARIDQEFDQWWSVTLGREPGWDQYREQFRACFIGGAIAGTKVATEIWTKATLQAVRTR